MKKHLLLLCAITMMALSSNAQSKQIWWGYFNESDASNLEYSGYLGYSQACTIDAAIFIPANHPIAGTGKIKSVRFWLGDDLSCINGDLTLWISESLPTDISSADYTQKVSKWTLSSRKNEIQLNNSYSINNKGIYIGYSFPINYKSYPVMGGGEDVANSFYYRVMGREWENLSEKGNGSLALQVLLDGVTLKDNYVSPSDFGTSYILKGQTINVPIKITNYGSQPVTSISYIISTNGVASVEQTLSVQSLAFNTSTNVSIPLLSDAEAKKYVKTFTITKVNNAANEATDNTASGSLVTIVEKPVVVPVVEEFTATWCGWCPIGFDGMEKAKAEFGDKVVLIAVHCRDQMSIADYAPIAGLTSTYPNSIINREQTTYPSASGLKYYINQQLSNKISVAEVQAKAVWTSAAKTSILIGANTTFAYSEDKGDYGLAYALIEDGLTNSAWGQANNLSKKSGYESYSFWYNSSSEVYGLNFDNVPVAAWNIAKGVDGSVSSRIIEGYTQSFSYEADIQDKSLIQDKSKLRIVVMLIDRSTGKIVNAAQTNIAEPGTTAVDGIYSSVNVGETGRYGLDGRKMDTPRRGLNIIRMEDGSFRKVMVR